MNVGFQRPARIPERRFLQVADHDDPAAARPALPRDPFGHGQRAGSGDAPHRVAEPDEWDAAAFEFCQQALDAGLFPAKRLVRPRRQPEAGVQEVVR